MSYYLTQLYRVSDFKAAELKEPRPSPAVLEACRIAKEKLETELKGRKWR